MPCENCLSRREFLAKSTAAVAGMAAIAAGCGDGQIGPEGVTAASGSVSVKVATVSGLANVGQLVRVGPADKYLAVKRTGANTFAAFSVICTHEECVTDIANNAFACPCHGSRFDNNGRVIVGPAARDLRTFSTQYDAATDTLTIG